MAGILIFLFWIQLFRDHSSPESERTDLRNHKENLPVISPIVQPRGFSQKRFFLAVIVSSSPNKEENAIRRKVIRRTWGNVNRTRVPSNLPWKVVFMMGKPQDYEMNRTIMAEQDKHGDLLIGDYKDAYRNITTKLLMAFQWASQMKCTYILKTDDDVYIDIPKLMKWLLDQRDNNSVYGGVLYTSYVVRDKTHRHYVRREDLSLDHYPVFCKGAMFVISWSLVPKMVDLSKQIKRIGPDDAYVGLLAYQLGVTPVKIQEFFHTDFLSWFVSLISPCQFEKLMGIGDSLTPDQVYYIHQLKTKVSNRERFYTVCISLYMKFGLLLFLSCTLLLAFFYRRRHRCRIQ